MNSYELLKFWITWKKYIVVLVYVIEMHLYTNHSWMIMELYAGLLMNTFCRKVHSFHVHMQNSQSSQYIKGQQSRRIEWVDVFHCKFNWTILTIKRSFRKKRIFSSVNVRLKTHFRTHCKMQSKQVRRCENVFLFFHQIQYK